MADSFAAGDAEYARWDAGNIRGLGKRGRFLGTEKDADGNTVNVYELIDDEWGIRYPAEKGREIGELYFPDLAKRR